MQRLILKSMLIDARVTAIHTQDWLGLTIDAQLLNLADIVEYEQIEIFNPNTNSRLNCHALSAPSGQGDIIAGQGLAGQFPSGARIIISSYGIFSAADAARHWPGLIRLDANNSLIE